MMNKVREDVKEGKIEAKRKGSQDSYTISFHHHQTQQPHYQLARIDAGILSTWRCCCCCSEYVQQYLSVSLCRDERNMQATPPQQRIVIDQINWARRPIW
jgi:hypothetical protein